MSLLLVRLGEFRVERGSSAPAVLQCPLSTKDRVILRNRPLARVVDVPGRSSTN